MNLLEENITGEIGNDLYQCQIHWRNGMFLMDEPEKLGGKDRGPDPYSTLLAALAGCTLSTLRMYINRKGWDIPSIHVSLNLSQIQSTELTTRIERNIAFPSEIPDDQKERLLQIAGKCPISKILENKIQIQTTI